MNKIEFDPVEPKDEKSPKPYQISSLLAFTTVYDMELCDPGVPCLQGNGDDEFANGDKWGPDWYYKMAACPMQMHGDTILLRLPPYELTLLCGDTFGFWNGEPVVTVSPYSGVPHIRIDVYFPVKELGEPDWNAGHWQWELLHDG